MIEPIQYLIAGFGAIALLGVFWRMQGPVGTSDNLRVVTLLIVMVFTTMLAIYEAQNINAALGVLGAVAGYVFGMGKSSDTK